MAISLSELLRGNEPETAQIVSNLQRLLLAINAVRSAYGKPMVVTSGLRSMAQHEAIYRKKGMKPPKGSAHLRGLACDIWDRDGEFWRWCLQNLSLMEKQGLYLEDKNSTPTWVHLQLESPRSGNRIFVPFATPKL